MDYLHKAWSFTVAHWETILGVLWLVACIVNRMSTYWANHAGLKRAALLLTEAVSLLRSKDAPSGKLGPLKWALQFVPPADITVKPKDQGTGAAPTALVLSFVLLAQGCGGYLNTLGKIQASGEELRKATVPLVNARCEAVADTCAAGQKPEDCTQWVACRDLRRRIAAGFDAVQLAVGIALAAEASVDAVKRDDLPRLVAAATQALAEVVAMVETIRGVQ